MTAFVEFYDRGWIYRAPRIVNWCPHDRSAISDLEVEWKEHQDPLYFIKYPIEGGGDVLGQALDARVIDKVQLYLGPILTAGPIIAFPGRGAQTAASALRLQRVSYERVGQSVCIMGYPEVRPSQ
jgi:dihydrofolate reductase